MRDSRHQRTRPSSAADALDVSVWKPAAVATLGALLAQLDATIVNVSLSSLAADLDAPLATIQWVTSGYLLALTFVLPPNGWLIERIGAKALYLWCFALFTLSSALCGLAWSTGALIGFRLLQGASGGLLAPMGIGMMVTMPSLGFLTGRFGERRVAVAGALFALISTLALAGQATHGLNDVVLAGILFVRGMGLGAVGLPVVSMAYAFIGKDALPMANHHAQHRAAYRRPYIDHAVRAVPFLGFAGTCPSVLPECLGRGISGARRSARGHDACNCDAATTILI